MMMRWSLLPILALALFGVARSHPGGLDADGCHTGRTNCAKHSLADGEYHCHREQAEPAEEPPPLATPERVEPEPVSEIFEIDYSGGFTVWLDCTRRGPVMARYIAQRDVGDLDRHPSFRRDPDTPAECQQTSTGSYRRPAGSEQEYDRGHLVPANILDHSPEGIVQSNYMTNIVPMARYLNRYGAWRHTEITEECYRDIDELLIFAGVIWGDDASNDHFIDSHGIATPDRLWKLIIRGQGNVIAWLMPNTDEATAYRIDEFLVSARELEALIGEVFPADDFRKDEIPSTSWQVPIGCDRG